MNTFHVMQMKYDVSSCSILHSNLPTTKSTVLLPLFNNSWQTFIVYETCSNVKRQLVLSCSLWCFYIYMKSKEQPSWLYRNLIFVWRKLLIHIVFNYRITSIRSYNCSFIIPQVSVEHSINNFYVLWLCS